MINGELIQSFLKFLTQYSKNRDQPLSAAATHLIKNYLKYLGNLKISSTLTPDPNLVIQIDLFKKQPGFSDKYLTEIAMDLRHKGVEHQRLLEEDPDLIDLLLEINRESYSVSSQKLPSSMKTGRSVQESRSVMPGKLRVSQGTGVPDQDHGLLHLDEAALERIDEKKISEEAQILLLLLKGQASYEKDIHLVSQSPQFLALPKSIKELISKHPIESRILIKNLGLTFDHLQRITMGMLAIFLKSTGIIQYGLKPRGIFPDDLMTVDEEKLAFLFSNLGGLYTLLDQNIPFLDLGKIEKNRLELLVEHPIRLDNLFKHHVSIDQLVAIDEIKLKLFIDTNPNFGFNKLMESGATFEQLAKLSIEELQTALSQGKLHGIELVQQKVNVTREERLSSSRKITRGIPPIPLTGTELEGIAKRRQELSGSHTRPIPPVSSGITETMVARRLARINAKFSPRAPNQESLNSSFFIDRKKSTPAPLATEQQIQTAVKLSGGLFTVKELTGMSWYVIDTLIKPECLQAIRDGLLTVDNFANQNANYIYFLMTSKCIDALREGLFTSTDLLHIQGDAIRQLLEPACLKGLREELFTATSLINLGANGIMAISKNECLQALREGLFTADHFNGQNGNVIASCTSRPCLQALKEGRTTMEQIIQMDTHERTQAIQTGEFPEPPLRPK